jgi:hypothetical protein
MRRAPVRTGRPPPYVLRDTARRSLSRPPRHRSVLFRCELYRQTQAASSKEKSRAPSRQTPPRSLRANARSRPAARLFVLGLERRSRVEKSEPTAPRTLARSRSALFRWIVSRRLSTGGSTLVLKSEPALRIGTRAPAQGHKVPAIEMHAARQRREKERRSEMEQSERLRNFLLCSTGSSVSR